MNTRNVDWKTVALMAGGAFLVYKFLFSGTAHAAGGHTPIRGTTPTKPVTRKPPTNHDGVRPHKAMTAPPADLSP